jgi:hypothetical protein
MWSFTSISFINVRVVEPDTEKNILFIANNETNALQSVSDYREFPNITHIHKLQTIYHDDSFM